MIKAVGAVALTIVLLTGVTATADPEACRGAIRTFKSARSSVGDYLRRYASCVSRSDGHDNCSSEFSRLPVTHHAIPLVALLVCPLSVKSRQSRREAL
jgi:hypothetical protein